MNRSRIAVGAFSLVEVTLSLGIAVFCLVVIFGLMSVGLNMSAVSVEQTTATNILATVASDLRTAPNIFPKGQSTASTLCLIPIPQKESGQVRAFPNTDFPIPIYLDGNGRSVEKAKARYQVTGWYKPGTGREATMMNIRLTWPAVATIDKAAGSVEMLVALDRN